MKYDKRIIFGIVVIVLIVWIIVVFRQEAHIKAVKLIREPDSFVNMTEEQMQNFPHLKESILTNKSIDIVGYQYEEAKLRGVLEYFDTYFICYQNEYYEIYFSCS